MSHSYCTNLVHCVFSTKERAPTIAAEVQERLWAYLEGIAKNHHISLLAVGGIANHVHVLFSVPQTMTVASAVNSLKANSSRWLREQGNSFEWQKGYGAFSVSPSQAPAVQAYIRSQAEHHAKHTFEDEFTPLALGPGATRYPPLPRWANEFRASGAAMGGADSGKCRAAK
jgi:putative transposase